jgi:methionine-gamma-lyase
MKRFDPSTEIQDYQVFGEFGGVNPSISDSSTFTFLEAEIMEKTFSDETHGCYLYGRHWTPTNKALSESLAKLEHSEAATVTASGMAAIHSTLAQLCSQGDQILSSRTVYGGTYALMKNVLPRLGIQTQFVDIKNLAAIEKAMTPKTRILYCETLSNPLLDYAPLKKLKDIAHRNNALLVVDNTFSPLIFSPTLMGADIVIHSMTKFLNGASDCIAGCICGSQEFIDSLMDVQQGVCMLTGPVLDSLRSASILKNLHTLHLRIKQHSANALYLAHKLEKAGVKVYYPGLKSHPQHKEIRQAINPEYGFGGILSLDMGSLDQARTLVVNLQKEKVGYLAVSLGFYKTLFSIPGASTSSEIPRQDQDDMGLSDGLVRMSVGLDNHIDLSWQRMQKAMGNNQD